MSDYERLVILNDQWAEQIAARQIDEAGGASAGGILDPLTGAAWPNHTTTAAAIEMWAGALANPDSARYRDPELADRLEMVCRFMLRFQHEDGTISPGWTNYHSPPDTAFVVCALARVVDLCDRTGWDGFANVLTDLRLWLRRSIPAMLTGGCHTPNHRWVMTAALGYLHRMFGLPELEERAEAWLSEGLDATPDGEWTERSNGIYNAVSDTMLIHASQLLDKPELLDSVRRNLRMMVYLVHPDGEVVTDYSSRQDFGRRHTLAYYYCAYRLMEEIDGDPLYAAMADLAAEAILVDDVPPNQAIIGHLLHPRWRERSGERAALPESYRIVLNRGYAATRAADLDQLARNPQPQPAHGGLHTEFGSRVARYRHGKTSVTAMTEAPSFFSLRHGAVRLLGVLLASTFDPGSMRMQELEEVGGGCRLSGSTVKGYYGPLPASELTSSGAPWYLLPHGQRPMTHEQRHSVEALVTEADGGWDISLSAEGPERVLTQVLFLFGAEGELTADLPLAEDGEGRLGWHGGGVRYACGGDWLHLEGGVQQHALSTISHMAYPSDCIALVAKLMTPYAHTFRLRLS
ncbi:hypothetical protein ACTHPH_06305 [Paenibacillus pasadenensis]|uniref:hypothetical protein n=1 Tax=Paenibacillus pasadenensis TaxID=217090 RepID=UPI000425ACC2|nr:hypothetical protein [Paenibacillus pasadenensis]